jgi:hypothetical protein
MKIACLTFLVLLSCGVSHGFDTGKNPDRVPSFGLDLYKGQLTGIDRKLAETNGGTVGGAFDFRLPVSNALTVRAFAETEGVNNNLRYSDGYKIGVGMRIFLQDLK